MPMATILNFNVMYPIRTGRDEYISTGGTQLHPNWCRTRL